MTYKTPPNNKHFEDFHGIAQPRETNKLQIEQSQLSEASNALPGHLVLSVQGSYPVVLPQSFFPPINPYPLPSYPSMPLCRHIASPAHQTDFSSDSSNITAMHPFPSISEFLEKINGSAEAKNRNISEFLEKFKEKRVHSLDELKGVSADEYEEKFGLVWGDAYFLHKAVEQTIRNIERARKEGQKHQRQHE
jgi:hypothetical protein